MYTKGSRRLSYEYFQKFDTMVILICACRNIFFRLWKIPPHGMASGYLSMMKVVSMPTTLLNCQSLAHVFRFSLCLPVTC